MRLSDWLRPALVFPAVDAPTVQALVTQLAPSLGAIADLPLAAVEAALWRGFDDTTGSIGRGVALPHAELDGLRGPLVAVAILSRPLPVPALDGVPPDVFFCILAPPSAPDQHLLLLAHIARLSQSRILLDGLRQARTPDAVVTLLRAADARHRPSPELVPDAAEPAQLIAISIAGERALDALLVELVDMDLDDATLLEGQSIREAVAREVPLFSGFRDLFGDPGGRRLILVEAPAGSVDAVVAAVQAVCQTHAVRHARVTTLPITARWEYTAPRAEEGAGGH